MTREKLDTHQKAFQINMDANKYGTIAEIGAGQEVAHWFFVVGGAAGTIAKSMSAYDMNVSDAIYGSTRRYVSRDRLMTMLDYEYSLLLKRLQDRREETTQFFTFADTVAARSHTRAEAESHGWMGIRFQHQPGTEPSDIVLHVRMLEKENLQQQEALGLLGINLIHSAFHLHHHPDDLIASLVDNIAGERVEVDLAKFSGPAFPGVDNRLMALELVERGLTDAAMFRANGEVVQPGELLYRKAVLVERGSFRPFTNVTLDMLNRAHEVFVREPQVHAADVIVVAEMTLKNLSVGDEISHRDFLDRVDTLSGLGTAVLITNYLRFFRLAAYLFRYTKKNVGLVMGLRTLREVFQEEYYRDLEGGILEAFGRLFKNDLKLYVHPQKDRDSGALVTAEMLSVAQHLRHLYAYLIENRFIESLQGVNEAYLSIFPQEVLTKIQSGDPAWEAMVPPQVSQIIKDRKLFRYRPAASAPTSR